METKAKVHNCVSLDCTHLLDNIQGLNRLSCVCITQHLQLQQPKQI